MLATVAVLAYAAGASGIDFADVRRRGAIRILVNLDTHRPEFFAVDPARPKGFDHEVLEGFATLHKLKLDVVQVQGWGALIPALIEGKGDVIAGRFTATEGRRKQIDFTVEVFPYRAVVMTRKPHRVVTSVEELRQETVGTTRGTNMAELLEGLGIPPGHLDDTIPTGAYGDALRSGRITAAVWGVESAIASQREDPGIQLGMFVGVPGQLAYGVRKGDRELLKALDDHIDSLRRSPAWSRLVVKYFGDAAPEILRKARMN